MNEDTGARIYCARGGNAWGLGFSKYQAMEACVSQGSIKNGATISVVKLPPKAYAPQCDSFHGDLYWSGDNGDCEKVGYFKFHEDYEGAGYNEFEELDAEKLLAGGFIIEQSKAVDSLPAVKASRRKK